MTSYQKEQQLEQFAEVGNAYKKTDGNDKSIFRR